MRLAEFILRDMEDILREWDRFARAQRPAADRMSAVALRNHAADILRAVVGDIERPREHAARGGAGSEGGTTPSSDTATRMHAVLHARAGFDINQLCAEFRALRASVLRLWSERHPPLSTDFADVLHFNEAIDHALSESVEYFERQVDQSRNLLLGALGHDLRNPLDAIQVTAVLLAKIDAGEQVAKAAQRLKNSAGRMKSLLDDLLDYNRSTLGAGMSIAPRDIDLTAIVETELQQLRTAYPGWTLALEATSDTRGRWDPHRLQQLVGNLVSNAIKYGENAPVRVLVRPHARGMRLEVRNRGPRIGADELGQLFEPLKRGSTAQGRPQSTSLGLGLYIAREIVRAHHGHIDARHVDGETVFAVTLPRAPDLQDGLARAGDAGAGLRFTRPDGAANAAAAERPPPSRPAP